MWLNKCTVEPQINSGKFTEDACFTTPTDEPVHSKLEIVFALEEQSMQEVWGRWGNLPPGTPTEYVSH